jgi:hypothetical protein
MHNKEAQTAHRETSKEAVKVSLDMDGSRVQGEKRTILIF